MKKFSILINENNGLRFFKVNASIELIIPGDNEGEVGYISDDILSTIEYMSNYQIDNIDETDDRIVEDRDIIKKDYDLTIDEQIEKSWDEQFIGKTPNRYEMMEWYHIMRKSGYDGIKILNVLKQKIKNY